MQPLTLTLLLPIKKKELVVFCNLGSRNFKPCYKTEFYSINKYIPVLVLSGRSNDEDFGPHIRTVQSSDTEAIIWWYTGFHETQFTVLLCPVKTAIGNSRLMCHTYTLLSEKYYFTIFNVINNQLLLSAKWVRVTVRVSTSYSINLVSILEDCKLLVKIINSQKIKIIFEQ